jgi:hypothetical protein
MTIKSIHYLALSPDQRKRGADKQRESLRGLLASPILTDEQRQAVRERLEHVRKWEHGELEAEVMPGEEVPEEALQKFKDKKDLAAKLKAGPNADKGKGNGGKEHEVKIKENVPVKDDVG